MMNCSKKKLWIEINLWRPRLNTSLTLQTRRSRLASTIETRTFECHFGVPKERQTGTMGTQFLLVQIELPAERFAVFGSRCMPLNLPTHRSIHLFIKTAKQASAKYVHQVRIDYNTIHINKSQIDEIKRNSCRVIELILIALHCAIVEFIDGFIVG